MNRPYRQRIQRDGGGRRNQVERRSVAASGSIERA
jgi:hypothetical protein